MTYEEEIANLIRLYKSENMGNIKRMKKFVSYNLGVWDDTIEKIYKRQVTKSYEQQNKEKVNEKHARKYLKKKYGDDWELYFNIYTVRKELKKLALEQIGSR